MSLNSITKYTLDQYQYLDAIRGLLELLKIGEEDEEKLREAAPGNQEIIASFCDPTIPAGCFYEDPFFDHVNVYLGRKYVIL